MEGPLCFELVLRVIRRGRSADSRSGCADLLSATFDDLSSAAVDASYTHALPSNGVEINYTLPAGKQTAYYIRDANNYRNVSGSRFVGMDR